ncbi:MAG: hypothetical protein AB7S26_36130 [Sandaracinaceae bacterium]
MRRASVLALLAWLWTGTALADADLDAGIASLEEGEFDAALTAFERAESHPLDRAELSRLYANRALAHHALADRRAMETDLLRFASLDPQGELPAAAPPPVHDAFARARAQAGEGLALEVAQHRDDATVRFTASVVRDLGALASSVDLAVRRAGQRDWIVADGASVDLDVEDGETVEVAASARAASGALLFELGTRDAPRAIVVGEPEDAIEDEVDRSLQPATEQGDDSVAIGVGVGLTVAVLLGAAAAVLAYVFLVDQAPRNEIGAPSTRIWGLTFE